MGWVCGSILPGGKFCPDRQLPHNHDCTGIGSWNTKPLPAIGMNYSRGGGVTVTGGVARETRRKPEKKTGNGLPNLKIIIVLIPFGLAWPVLTGY